MSHFNPCQDCEAPELCSFEIDSAATVVATVTKQGDIVSRVKGPEIGYSINVNVVEAVYKDVVSRLGQLGCDYPESEIRNMIAQRAEE